MSKHLLETFFNEKNSELDKLYMSLDCWEQIIYKSLQPYNLDYKYVFVSDIYPVYVESKEYWSLMLPEKDLKQSIYEEKSINYINGDYITTIESLLKQNEFVVFHTVFDLIPEYDKKEIKVTGRIHHSIIVGFDDNHFYIMDNPNMFNKSKSTFYLDFNNICIINKTLLNNAFKKKCELKIIKIKTDSLHSLNNLDKVLNQILNTFHYKEMEKHGEYNMFYGKQALMKLIEALDTSSDKCLRNSFLNNHYNAHLLYLDRLILKWCLEDSELYRGSIYFQDVIKYLDISIEKWQIVKMMIAKNNVKSSQSFFNKLKDKMQDILKIEEKFIENISELILL